MRAFIKRVAKAYFEDRRREFGEDARFSEFLIVDGTTTKKNSYPADVYGYIMYSSKKMLHSTPRLRLQYFHCDKEDPKFAMISSWFASDVVFYQHIWPACCDQWTPQLVPKFQGYGELTTGSAQMGALLFKCGSDRHNFGYSCRLPYENLCLMAGRIGQLHGAILRARTKNQLLLSLLVNTLPARYQPDTTRSVATLRRCLRPLYERASFVDDIEKAAGLSRLTLLIADLDRRLNKHKFADSRYYTVCHRNYSQSCVFFRYNEQGLAIDLEIGYWAKVGWASLADDLVIMLFVDADSHWDMEKREYLVDVYVRALRDSCSNCWVPSNEEVWREIKCRIAAALHAMAVRVEVLRRRSSESETTNQWLWDDHFVTNVYKLLIRNKLV